MFVSYMWQGVMTAEEFWDLVLEGLKNMMMPLMLMILAFLFAERESESDAHPDGRQHSADHWGVCQAGHGDGFCHVGDRRLHP